MILVDAAYELEAGNVQHLATSPWDDEETAETVAFQGESEVVPWRE